MEITMETRSRKVSQNATRGRVSWSDNLENVYLVGRERALPVAHKQRLVRRKNELNKTDLSLTMPSTPAGRALSPTLSICSDVSDINLDVIESERPIKLSIDDFRLALDLERSRSKQVSRCEAIKSAQTRLMTIYAKARHVRHGPTDSMSLPSYSRPQTRTESHETLRERARSAVTLPPPATSTSEEFQGYAPIKRPPTSKMCIRVQSMMGDYPDVNVNSVCRQCCEVLGPSACHQCAKIQRKQKDMHKFQKAYPAFLDPEEDMIAGIIVKKHFPLADSDHIQNLVAQGQISSPNFRETLNRLKEEARRKAVEAENRRNSIQKSASRGRDTYRFFSSIRDLNQKIVTGRANKKVTNANLQMTKGEQAAISRAEKKMTFTELICPMFISPKRLKSDPPGFIANYSPPLLARESQNVEPSFFAGSETPYKLPDRLPEKINDSDEATLNIH